MSRLHAIANNLDILYPLRLLYLYMGLGKKQKEILKAIGAGLVVTSAFVAPNIIQLLNPKNRQEKHHYKKAIQKLFNDEIIYLSGEEIKLSEEGLKLLRMADIEDIKTIKITDDWDGVWHLVCYDVPEDNKKERDYLRRKLINLGFCQVQYSLWVIPWSCKEEIAVIAQSLGIAPFVAYLNTDYLPQQKKLEFHFGLNQK